jgi:hypothetical protein
MLKHAQGELCVAAVRCGSSTALSHHLHASKFLSNQVFLTHKMTAWRDNHTLIATIQIYVSFATMLPLHHHAIACLTPQPMTSCLFSVPQSPTWLRVCLALMHVDLP